MATVKAAKVVESGDLWQAKSNAERQAWLKRARCGDHWYTTTFEDLPQDVREALEAAA